MHERLRNGSPVGTATVAVLEDSLVNRCYRGCEILSVLGTSAVGQRSQLNSVTIIAPENNQRIQGKNAASFELSSSCSNFTN